MSFREIQPTKPSSASTTGVRASLSDRSGLTITIGASALDVLGALEGNVASARVLLDLDPCWPRVRVIGDPTGMFTLANPPGRTAKGGFFRLLRLGRREEIEGKAFERMDCKWELGDVPGSIDIELPREMAATHEVTKPVGVPSNSSSGGRTTTVTLPGRVKDPV